MSTEKLPIVVALDGSPEAGAALDWALLEAQSRTTPLRLVCSLAPYKSFLARQTDGPMSVSRQQQAQTVAATMLATAAEHSATVAPEVTVTTHLYHDDNDAAKVLLAESARASTIVLGSRRRGALGSAVMGSVGTAVS
ncbi:MAG: universal stress protein, partial [Antricoccus sp.]